MSGEYRFEIFRSKKNQQWYFRFVATNHEIFAQSEGYENRKDCEHAIFLFKVYAPSADLREVDA